MSDTGSTKQDTTSEDVVSRTMIRRIFAADEARWNELSELFNDLLTYQQVELIATARAMKAKNEDLEEVAAVPVPQSLRA